MRKYLIGMFFGVALTISSGVFADDIQTLINQKVQGEFPVKINGETLVKPAIVINGTSYLPNRAIADALNMEIKFDADLGIELSNKEVSALSISENSSPTNETIVQNNVVYDSVSIEGNINVNQSAIKYLNIAIDDHPDSPKIPEWQSQIIKYQDDLALWEARKAALTQ